MDDKPQAQLQDHIDRRKRDISFLKEMQDQFGGVRRGFEQEDFMLQGAVQALDAVEKHALQEEGGASVGLKVRQLRAEAEAKRLVVRGKCQAADEMITVLKDRAREIEMKLVESQAQLGRLARAEEDGLSSCNGEQVCT